LKKTKIQSASNKPKSKAKPAAQSPSKPAAQSPSKPAAKSPSKPAAKSPSKPAGKSPKKPSGRSPKKPSGRSPSKPSGNSRITNANKKIGAGKLAHTCVKAFFDSVPPSICWKKGGDVGQPPRACPMGYFRHHELCFQNCKPGYSFDGGALCIQNCERGWDTHPLTCFKLIFQVRTRDSYFTHSITNFEAPCNEGQYKSAALCYRDCTQIGMVNCGIGMCAASDTSCGLGIAEMGIDNLVAIGKGIAFVASFGTSTVATTGVAAAKSAIMKNLQKVTKAVKNAVSSMKIMSKNPSAKKRFFDKLKQQVKKTVKELPMEKRKEKMVETICEEVHNDLFQKISEKDENNSPAWEKLDVLEFGDIVENCSDLDADQAGVKCTQSILKTLDNFDPTGLTGLAAAYMHPHCDI